MAGTLEFVHIEQISALYKFHCTRKNNVPETGSFHPRMRRETLFFLVFRIPDNGQSPQTQ
jgi:hypothetical protein